jgi:hypothetical protein
VTTQFKGFLFLHAFYLAVSITVFQSWRPLNAEDGTLLRIRAAVGENAFADDFDGDGRVDVQINYNPSVTLRTLANLNDLERASIDRVNFYVEPEDDAGAIRCLEKLPGLRLLDTKQWNPALSEFVSKSNTLEEIWAQPSGAPAGITGKDLALICRAKQLRLLMIQGNRLNAAELASLAALKELYQLNLAGFDVGTKDVMWLASMTNLSTLWLGDTNVDDEIVPVLAQCKKLKILELTHTNVTTDGVAKLAVALPHTIISSGGRNGSEAVAVPKPSDK